MNNKLLIIREGSGLSLFKVTAQNLIEGTEKNYEKPHSR
jgi:hypothetical protein